MHKSIKKSFVKQTYQSWCGIACLSMLCKYYGGNVPQAQLVNISGTSTTGTTLLGLYQAAHGSCLKSDFNTIDTKNTQQTQEKDVNIQGVVYFVKNHCDHCVDFF